MKHTMIMWVRWVVVLALAAALTGCAGGVGAPAATLKVEKAAFGKLPDGRTADLYILTNARGLKMTLTNYGGIVVSLWAPDKSGKTADVVLGYDKLEEYLKDTPYFGAIVGRYGNRIARGKFTLDGKEYPLATNNNENHLHGGLQGFDKVLWRATPLEKADAVGVRLTYASKDMEEGYPGNLQAAVTYWLTNANEMKIEYEVTTDRPTVQNLTHHGYFNLAGAGSGNILGHQLLINADRFTPVDKGLIPTGERRPVRGTPMDFTAPTAIGSRVNQDDEQLKFGLGYDHNWVLNKKGSQLTLAARVIEPTTGRRMEVWTTEPGIQFYCGNFLDGHNVGKGGRAYQHRYGFCLETQHFPDSPNQPSFPTTVLRPGDTYRSTTVYKFLAK